MLKLSRHYPNPEDLVTDLVTGVTLINSLLNLAEHGQERSTQALADNLMNEAAAFSEYAGRALYNAGAAAERTMALFDQHVNSPHLPNDSSLQQHAQALEEMQLRAESLQDAVSLHAVELSYRNRRTPLLEDQVKEDAVFLQQEIRLIEATRLAALLSDRNVTRHWDDATRTAYAVACEYTFMAPSQKAADWHEFPEPDEDDAPEDQEIYRSLERRGSEARIQMAQAIEPVLTRCAESMTTSFSPSLTNHPRMARWYATSPKWLSVSEPGLLFDPQTLMVLKRTQEVFLNSSGQDRRRITQDPPMDPEHDTFILFVSFVHQGVRVIKTVQDPYPKGYPKGYPKELANFHILQCRHIISQIHRNPRFPEIATAYLNSLLDTSEQLLAREMHDISPKTIAKLLAVLDEENVPRGLVAKTFNAIADDDRAQAQCLATPEDQERAKAVSTSQAWAVIAHARTLQLDDAALEAMSLAMGYLPEELNLTSPGLPEETYRKLEGRISELGLPKSLKEQLSYRLEP